MSGVEFWQTPMGKRFFESTLPELVTQLRRLADLGERALPLVEAVLRPAQARVGTSPAPASPAPSGAPAPGG